MNKKDIKVLYSYFVCHENPDMENIIKKIQLLKEIHDECEKIENK